MKLIQLGMFFSNGSILVVIYSRWYNAAIFDALLIVAVVVAIVVVVSVVSAS